jgi:predicted RNase H-like HicB family nuclease
MHAKYIVVLDREVDGRWIASVPGVPGCHVYGRTSSAAVRRLKSALRFYLAELRRLGKKPPRQPKPLTVEIDIAV